MDWVCVINIVGYMTQQQLLPGNIIFKQLFYYGAEHNDDFTGKPTAH